MKRILDAAFAHPRGVAGLLGAAIMARSTKQRNAWIIALLDVQPSDHILEVGFGPGVVVQSLATIATEGMVDGIDLSPLMVKQASRRNAQAIREGRVHLQQGDALALPFEEQTFDKALSINSVMLWPDSLAGIKEQKRVLKPGGLLAVALQPVWAKSDDEVKKIGEELMTRVIDAGFQHVRLAFQSFKPIACVCILANK